MNAAWSLAMRTPRGILFGIAGRDEQEDDVQEDRCRDDHEDGRHRDVSLGRAAPPVRCGWRGQDPAGEEPDRDELHQQVDPADRLDGALVEEEQGQGEDQPAAEQRADLDEAGPRRAVVDPPAATR